MPIGISGASARPLLALASILHVGPGIEGGAGTELIHGSCRGEGGGSLAIYARGGITVGDGASISAPGAQPLTAGCGGGGGGVIVLASEGRIVLSGSATIDVSGGNGAAGNTARHSGGGGGGGGLIRLISPNARNDADVAPSRFSLVVSAGGGGATTSGVGSCSSDFGFGGGATAGRGGDGGCGPAPAMAGLAGLIVRTQTAGATSLLGGR